MYSPKIAEDLIPVLYKMVKAQGRPMTKIVNDIIRKSLAKIDLPPLIDFLRYASPFPQTKHQAYRI